MIVSDRSQMKSSKQGFFPDIKCLYSMIPRDIRMHMYRVSCYAMVLLEQAERDGVWDERLPEDIWDYAEQIFRLHDIGRHYIPAELYNKVEALTQEEMQEIRKHTLYALEAEKSVFFPIFPEHIMPFFREVALMHHERWDGMGYPYGRKGTEIPFLARVCAVADTYDGMVSWKPYRERISGGDARKILQKESGKQFQPELVECFVKCRKEIELLDITMNGK